VETEVRQRKIQLERRTKEVSINAEIDLDGTGKYNLNTGIPFLDHIIGAFSKHSKIDINLMANSEDQIKHHLIEDIGIVLGQSINKALGSRERISRFGYAIIPMDESISRVAIDLIKRQYSIVNLKLEMEKTEDISREDITHFIESLVSNLNCCTHIIVEYGSNDHHKIESAVKALALALKEAVKIHAFNEEKPTTKGVM
jgi:imidazoleglycerol-phosphate dehydratase